MDLKEPRGVCFAGLMADRNGIAALAAAVKIGVARTMLRHSNVRRETRSGDSF
jgi:hypothetical protein